MHAHIFCIFPQVSSSSFTPDGHSGKHHTESLADVHVTRTQTLGAWHHRRTPNGCIRAFPSLTLFRIFCFSAAVQVAHSRACCDPLWLCACFWAPRINAHDPRRRQDIFSAFGSFFLSPTCLVTLLALPSGSCHTHLVIPREVLSALACLELRKLT